MKRIIAGSSAALLLLIAGAALASGGGWRVARHTVSGGGGDVQHTVYAVRSTVGQPFAGTVHSETQLICAGLWCGPGVEVHPPVYTVYLPVVLQREGGG
ncbi:MAG: hypothetical protein JXB35_17230 [Anaerolineae bacterium]|nr:hypothetical protein [Anaerolineae bacterium]